MFITFEGIDGSGKTTQVRLIAEKLKSLGRDIVMIREPGGTQFSENIREILLNSKHDINSISELMLFEAARADLTDKVIKPALAEGKIVIADRFYDSTTAYQGYGRQIPLEHVNTANKLGSLGLVPNMTFYLRVTMQLAKKRSSRRNHDRIESSGDNFFKRVLEGFDAIAAAEPNRFHIIDSFGTVEETYIKIWEIVKERL